MLQAFHNKQEIKTKYLNRVKAHIEADELIHGVGWENGKGCAVGCTLNRYDHACYQNELGLPEWLARLEDILFENMSNAKSQRFPLELLQAIPIGADLTQVYHKFQIYLLEDCKKNITKDFDYVIKAVDQVIDLHLKMASGLLEDSAARSAAESAARSAWSAARSAWSAAWSAESAARSAARSAWSAAWSAESAAWSAARSAESAAWSAAWSAARSAARSAWSAARSARSAAFDRYADKLLELLKNP